VIAEETGIVLEVRDEDIDFLSRFTYCNRIQPLASPYFGLDREYSLWSDNVDRPNVRTEL
jgi:hypothetical protein